MKKLLLTTMVALAILFARAQTPCDSVSVSGSQNQLTLTSISIIDYWITTAPDGTVLGQDSLWNQHSVFNYNPTGSPYDTIVTCLFTMNTTCCLTYVWNGSVWTIPGGTPTPSWDCAPNTILGCADPGTGLGQYTSLSSCQAACGAPLPSWDCDPTGVVGCFDPGTGTGQYTTLAACQAVCASTVSNLCDSMTLFSTGGSPQTILMAEVPNINTIIDYWITTAPDGTVLGEDSMWNSHQIFNNMNNGQPYDTINVCISYFDAIGYSTCCVTWIWDANSGLWARMGSVTSIGEIGSFDKKLIKVVDLLGRETSVNSNQTLFFIYEDGTIEKRYIIDRN
jgi:hypothetical protein